MGLLRKQITKFNHKDQSTILYDEAKKYHDKVKVFEDVKNEYGRDLEYTYRIHIRTANIDNALIYALEQLGYKCNKGQTCNEWETSMRVQQSKNIHIHPPHMPVSVTPPEDLEKMSPTWYEFLNKVKFLGHLTGDLSNGIDVEKQAFGECDTSIVLETYKTAYGSVEYKEHQCDQCIDFELAFKDDIMCHDFALFEVNLHAFVDHFKTQHPKEFNIVTTKPFKQPPRYRGDGLVRSYLDQPYTE